MSDIAGQIAQLERQYDSAVRAEALAQARVEQAREAESAALARLTELGFPSVEAAEKFMEESQQALQQQVAALTAELGALPT